jgi:hypothetical protein
MSEAPVSSQKTRERQRRCGSVDCSKRGTSGLALTPLVRAKVASQVLLGIIRSRDQDKSNYEGD